EVKVEEELPKDLNKDMAAAVGEASLRGHLKNPDDEARADEEDGSSSYVAEDKSKDTQLNYALDLLHGIKSVDTSADKKVQATYPRLAPGLGRAGPAYAGRSRCTPLSTSRLRGAKARPSIILPAAQR